MSLRFVAVALLLATACVAGRPATSPSPSPYQSGEIGTAELRRTDAGNLYDAIARLRPTYFATRGVTSFLNQPPRAIVVVVNGTIVGGINDLYGISPNAVRSVRRLSAADVFHLTGRSAPSGGIELVYGP